VGRILSGGRGVLYVSIALAPFSRTRRTGYFQRSSQSIINGFSTVVSSKLISAKGKIVEPMNSIQTRVRDAEDKGISLRVIDQSVTN
jgi:hypothetical protein